MRLANTLVSYTLRRDSNDPWKSIEAVHVFKKVGFDSLDIYFNKVIDWLSEEEQDEWVNQMNQAIEESGMPISQCHAYFGKTKSIEEYKERVARSIELAGRMNISWAVVHPITHEENVSLEDSIHENVEFFKQLQKVAAPGEVGVAFENIHGTEYATAEALIALCQEAKKYGNVGVCWDTGHANMVPDMNQPESIMRLGKLLKCTHIHDNHGKTDEHTLPMMGNIDWKPLIKALKESGYEGDLVYESGQPMKHLPDDNILRMELMKYYVKLGRYLLELA